MSQTYVAAARRRARLPRLALAAPVALGALAAGRATRGRPAPIGPDELVCEQDRPPPAPAPAPRPSPPASSYDRLRACLRDWAADPSPHSIGRYIRSGEITVDKVRHYVEVEHD